MEYTLGRLLVHRFEDSCDDSPALAYIVGPDFFGNGGAGGVGSGANRLQARFRAEPGPVDEGSLARSP